MRYAVSETLPGLLWYFHLSNACKTHCQQSCRKFATLEFWQRRVSLSFVSQNAALACRCMCVEGPANKHTHAFDENFSKPGVHTQLAFKLNWKKGK